MIIIVGIKYWCSIRKKSMDTSIKNQIENSQTFLNQLKSKQLGTFLEGVKEGENNPLVALNIAFQSQNVSKDKYKLFIDSLKQSLQENRNTVLKTNCKQGGGKQSYVKPKPKTKTHELKTHQQTKKQKARKSKQKKTRKR